ncbi:4-phosphoerythronate dehydrogenase PdxB [Oceaniserpentilla sp. 4NH20-0058]|uniref:4-phosphoerythronate dehydrogenase n=1 Tax=Oceaniserpentilla sp. 4NH20-0058 TaxID=3127660 RepID=UPI0031070FA4
MKIVADENIPLLNAFFSDMCQELVTLPGREMRAEHVKDADILLVRSITQVNAKLLQNSKVKFVGTCTIGTDHLDTTYLEQAGIQYANAPGCNAKAVVDYILSALLVLQERKQTPWQSLSVGIVGAGNVGGLLYDTLKALGMKVVAYDPNVEAFASNECSEQVWQQDVVTLHTPIIKQGEHTTYHLVDENRFAKMKDTACLINSCRGEVVDNQALLKHKNSHPNFECILDVYEQEPAPTDELIKACLLATPHIAGYSLDGKYGGTAMIYEALCDVLALPKRLRLAQLISEAPLRKLSFSGEADIQYILKQVIQSAYDIRDDHFRMLSLLGLTKDEKAKAFDGLRKEYPMRRDLTCQVVSSRRLSHAVWLQAMGVRIKQ